MIFLLLPLLNNSLYQVVVFCQHDSFFYYNLDFLKDLPHILTISDY